jgi:hypothetical protein
MKLKFSKSNTLFSVIHRKFATDRYEYGTTIVEAVSAEEAMEKLNAYLATKPDGNYTAMPCETLDDVSQLSYLSGNFKRKAHVFTSKEISKARKFYNEHWVYVDKLLNTAKLIGYPPSLAEDIRNPALWKAEHWRWFMDFHSNKI